MSTHLPVLESETVSAFRDTSIKINRFLDGTFGRGGHTRAVIDAFPDIQVVAMDHDEEAVKFGKKAFADELLQGQITFVHKSFGQFGEWNSEDEKFDLMLLDLGVSSPQLDQSYRGFSFYTDGPLDMRMDDRMTQKASDVINSWSQSQLIQLFLDLGEIRRPQRVVAAIIKDREEKPFLTTRELASLIERVEGWSRRHHHPATRYFLALRLSVNQELEVLKEAIPQLVDGLSDKGRLAIITFHSLEDRIVKYGFKALLDRGVLVNKKVIRPPWDDVKKNPRARSAKLRVFEKREEL